MEQTLAQYWHHLVAFLKEYDIGKVSELIRSLDWKALLHQPLFWVAAVPLVAWLIWKRHFRLMLLGASLLVFIELVQRSMPESGSVPLDRILLFIGGCVALIGINFYFLFIRRD